MNSCFKRIGAALCAAALAFGLAACGGTQAAPGANTAAAQPVSITVWNYYNGDQLESFNKLVEEFNATVGKEQNITVTSERLARWALPHGPTYSPLMPTPAMPWTRWACWPI